jgi:hypothetical protein
MTTIVRHSKANNINVSSDINDLWALRDEGELKEVEIDKDQFDFISKNEPTHKLRQTNDYVSVVLKNNKLNISYVLFVHKYSKENGKRYYRKKNNTIQKSKIILDLEKGNIITVRTKGVRINYFQDVENFVSGFDNWIHKLPVNEKLCLFELFKQYNLIHDERFELIPWYHSKNNLKIPVKELKHLISTGKRFNKRMVKRFSTYNDIFHYKTHQQTPINTSYCRTRERKINSNPKVKSGLLKYLLTNNKIFNENIYNVDDKNFVYYEAFKTAFSKLLVNENFMIYYDSKVLGLRKNVTAMYKNKTFYLTLKRKDEDIVSSWYVDYFNDFQMSGLKHIRTTVNDKVLNNKDDITNLSDIVYEINTLISINKGKCISKTTNERFYKMKQEFAIFKSFLN